MSKQDKAGSTHPTDVLLYALDDDFRETTVILGDHGEALDNGPRVDGQVS